MYFEYELEYSNPHYNLKIPYTCTTNKMRKKMQYNFDCWYSNLQI